MRSRSNSDQLFKRAASVIPGGTYGHLSPASSLPRHFAHFCSSGKGVYFHDVDQNEWMDFMCAYGAVIHGYQNPIIESAVEKQRSVGTVFNHPHEVSIELAEKLTQLVDFASWSVFAKNGSDLTTWSIRVAREHTKRTFVVKARGAYHGVDAWCCSYYTFDVPDETPCLVFVGPRFFKKKTIINDSAEYDVSKFDTY